MRLKMSYSLKMATREEIRDDYKIRGPVILDYITTNYWTLIWTLIKQISSQKRI